MIVSLFLLALAGPIALGFTDPSLNQNADFFSHDPLNANPNHLPVDPFMDLGGPVDPLGPADFADPLGDLTTFEKCTGYVPFKTDFICPEGKVNPMLSYDIINKQFDDNARFLPDTFSADACFQKLPQPGFPDKIVADRAQANLLVNLTEMCRPVDTPIYYVWSLQNRQGQRDVCVIVNNNQMTQSLAYTRCVDPMNSDSDLCRMDYSTRVDFKCIQSGFIKKKILVYCPISVNDGYYETHEYQVPTACSCRKCGFCEGNDALVDEFTKIFEQQSDMNFDALAMLRKK